MLKIREGLDKREFHEIISKNDSIIKINKPESLKDELSVFHNTSIIIESNYICDSSASGTFFEEKSKNDLNGGKKVLKKNDLKIVDFKKVIENRKNRPNFILTFDNNYFLISGIDNKIDIYSKNYIKIKTQKFDDRIININSIKNIHNNKEIIVSFNDKLHLFKFDENDFKFHSKNKIKGYNFCFEINHCDYIVGNKKGCYLFCDLFSSIIAPYKKKLIINKFYNSAIQINKNLIALTSNSILPNGEDKLIIYNNLIKEIYYEIKGYSFISSNSSNGLSIITKNENNILLCACKQYKKYQKNGIILVNVKFEEKPKINYFYYDTRNFEVYCFCQIYILDKTNNKILDENKITIATDYFLVGGFDKNKGRGIIKLYKIIENKTFLESKIEYIQDIEIEKKEKFKGFKGPISGIIQTKTYGELLVTCWDGNVYLLEKPNIELFLFYDNLKN